MPPVRTRADSMRSPRRRRTSRRPRCPSDPRPALGRPASSESPVSPSQSRVLEPDCSPRRRVMTPEESKTMPKNAVAYLRRSTDRQDQSIADQRAAIERHAREHGFTIVREYIDDAISGADTESRKAFLQMIEDAQKRDR